MNEIKKYFSMCFLFSCSSLLSIESFDYAMAGHYRLLVCYSLLAFVFRQLVA